MTGEAWLLVAWVLVGAAFLLAHGVVLWYALTASNLQPATRLLALLPPAAPMLAWSAGHRVTPVAWALLLVAYGVLRLLE